MNKISPTKLRGFLGYLFINEPEFHHHSESSFHYPLVQYKIINNNRPLVLGLQEYADIVFRKISQLENIVLPYEKVKIQSVKMDIMTFEIKVQEKKYKFVSPWLALNKENYLKYIKLEGKYRKHLLESIFVGNILSALKGMRLFIDYRILSEIQSYRQINTIAHFNQFVGFYAIIKTNISIPSYLGVGKSVSKGFGTIEEFK